MEQVNVNRPMNQPGQQMNQQTNQPMGGQNMGNQNMGTGSRSKMPWMILAVVVIIVLAVLGYLFRDKLSGSGATPALSGYQAVFLTNGQVYFGKLSDADSAYVSLRDIYYLQVNQQLQPDGSTQTAAQQQAAAAANPQLSLVKLGNELHGPADAMKINRDQILFYEDLKNDGKVAQAIVSYQKNGATPAAATGATGSTGTNPATGTPQIPATGTKK